jgi:hypothetical protein
MTKEEEALALFHADDGAPPLDPRFAARVQALARAALAPAAGGKGAPARVRMALSGALVPALLMSAAVVRTTHTVEVMTKIYDRGREKGR